MSTTKDERIHDTYTLQKNVTEATAHAHSAQNAQQLCVTYGHEKDEAFLKKVIELDRMVYPPELSGSEEAMCARFVVEPDQFIFVQDGEVLAGYINFFPMTGELCESVLNGPVMRDDDIAPYEIQPFSGEPNHLFVLSVVVRQEYRNGKAITKLMRAFTRFLQEKEEQGFPIASVAGAVVSRDGEKLLQSLWFERRRDIDEQSVLFVCEGDNLERLKRYAYYRPSYKSDLFIFTPLYVSGPVGAESKLPPHSASCTDGEAYIETVRENAEYECSNAVIEELSRICLGEYKLALLTDDYDLDAILDYEDVQLILTSHKKTELHVLTVVIADNKHSTTQLEDQMSTGNLLLNAGEGGSWINLFEFLQATYGLEMCGESKVLVCASNKPVDRSEMYCILCAETYNSAHVDYRIDCHDIEEVCSTNLAKYDYYEVYLYSSVLLFLPEEFKEGFRDRLNTEATYIFVLELAMFQTAAIQRTNERVTSELSSNNDPSLDFIEGLYAEFGETIRFWNPSNFKYKMAQIEAEMINQAFKTQESMEVFYRNQNYLEHLVDLRSARDERRSSRILNIALFALAMLQVIPLVGVFTEWLFVMQGWPEHSIPATVGSATFSVVILCVILVVLIFSERRRKTQERRRRTKHTNLLKHRP